MFCCMATMFMFILMFMFMFMAAALGTLGLNCCEGGMLRKLSTRVWRASEGGR
jgi:hypothetical protein